jgi:hypothetical protein
MTGGASALGSDGSARGYPHLHPDTVSEAWLDEQEAAEVLGTLGTIKIIIPYILSRYCILSTPNREQHHRNIIYK